MRFALVIGFLTMQCAGGLRIHKAPNIDLHKATLCSDEDALTVLRKEEDMNPVMAKYMMQELKRLGGLDEFKYSLSLEKTGEDLQDAPENVKEVYDQEVQETTVPKARMTALQSKALWILSKREEEARGNNLGTLSTFGKRTPKIPRSWVEKITELNHSKTHRYMFSGRVWGRRFGQWLEPFVRSNFTDEDYFKATNAPASYTAMGKFDKTLVSKGYVPATDQAHIITLDQVFDENYFLDMAQSKFILTPGGDAPWSMRFYESFLTGSLPIIHSMAEDLGNFHDTVHIKEIPYEYGFTATYPHTFDQAQIDRNLKRFIRYQTFIEGDNDPVQDKATGFQIS